MELALDGYITDVSLETGQFWARLTDQSGRDEEWEFPTSVVDVDHYPDLREGVYLHVDVNEHCISFRFNTQGVWSQEELDKAKVDAEALAARLKFD